MNYETINKVSGAVALGLGALLAAGIGLGFFGVSLAAALVVNKISYNKCDKSKPAVYLDTENKIKDKLKPYDEPEHGIQPQHGIQPELQPRQPSSQHGPQRGQSFQQNDPDAALRERAMDYLRRHGASCTPENVETLVSVAKKDKAQDRERDSFGTRGRERASRADSRTYGMG